MNNFEIAYEDDWLLVINKPAGVVVNRAESVKEFTVQDWMEQRYEQSKAVMETDQYRVWKQRSGIAHRLDKDTSGLLILCKDAITLRSIMKLFAARRVFKRYVAMVHGAMGPQAGVWNLPIERNPFERQSYRVGIDGKQSVTEFSVQARFHSPDDAGAESLSLLALYPKTGRTHQLRVHVTHHHHSIVADPWYATSKQQSHDSLWCPRLFLHATELRLTHPVTNEQMIIESKLPDDLKQAMNQLQSEPL